MGKKSDISNVSAKSSHKSKKYEKNNKHEYEYEFGGPYGVSFLIIWSHYILYYFWYCLEFHSGSLYIPLSVSELCYFPIELFNKAYEHAQPTKSMMCIYIFFFISQLLLAQFVPGFTILGYKIKSRNNSKLPYLINGFYCHYLSLLMLLILQMTGLFRIQSLCENFGSWLTTAVIIADVTSVYWYIYGHIYGPKSERKEAVSGNVIYDFFMGTVLYPRIGKVDIKMIAEIRWSWLTLVCISISCGMKQWDEYGTISMQMCFMIMVHVLYANACVKAEHYVVYCWDMYVERFGFMLNFWNIVGVPFQYCFSSMYIMKNGHKYIGNDDSVFTNSWFYIAFVYIFYFISYYIWDCSNSNKCHFKCPHLMKYNTKWPIFPHSFIENPKFIQTPNGKLLIDGFWKYARKMNILGDILQALTWGLITGFNSFCCYFYFVFFMAMCCHRVGIRDEAHCYQKYGKYWDEYKRKVPYLFIPGVF